MNPLTIVLFLFSMAVLQGCTSNEIGNSKDVNPETVFVEYFVSCTGETDSLECMAQFRFAGENGTTLVLNKPASVMLDKKELLVDSSEFEGAYYRYYSRPETFSGNHQWKYTDNNRHTYTESFNFRPIHLLTSLPAVISKKNLSLDWQNGLPGQQLMVEISDTAGGTADIHLSIEAAANHIIIPANALRSLVNGPVYIKLYIEENRTLKNAPREGGCFRFNYLVKQYGLELKD